MKKYAVAIALLISAARLFAQDAVPTGTILPVQLNHSVRTDNAKPGQEISARVMQDIPLPAGGRIRAGAKVIGEVVAVKPAAKGNAAEISLRFDTLKSGAQRIPIVTNLRALAGMMDVADAQTPQNGPDRGTSEYNWTTVQIGGEVNYHGMGAISNGSEIVGHSVADGVLVRVTARPGTNCRGEMDGNDHLQALWLFSSDACGLYGFPDVTTVHAGRSSPVGVITLRSEKGNLNVRAGSGMLLRVNSTARSLN
jgi:hypothetical protein